MDDPGYGGKILYIDLTSGKHRESPTGEYARDYLGGRGIATRLYWEEVPPGCSALDPENALIFAGGPMAGVPVLGGSRTIVCGKSPLTVPSYFSCANMGGRFAEDLKSLGYDALVIKGKASAPAYIFLDGSSVEIREAGGIWGSGAVRARQRLIDDLGEDVNVAAIGQAGENRVSIATVLSDNGAVASAGFGAIMGSKNLKAIAVRRRPFAVAVHDPDRLKALTAHFLGLGTKMMSVVGSMEFRVRAPQTRSAPCHRCMGGCLRRWYTAADGQDGKFMCQPATFYRPMAEGYGTGLDGAFDAARLCDDYGLDTMTVSTFMLWLLRCFRAGIITEEQSGIPLSRPGSGEFIESLVRLLATREGFGEVMAGGILSASRALGEASHEKIAPYLSKAGYPLIADPRLYIPAQLLHATEIRPPQTQLREVTVVVTRWVAWLNHQEDSYVSTQVLRSIARRFWGSDDAGDFSNHRGKALAAKLIQDREYAKDCLVMCSFLWPVFDIATTEDHTGDPTLESQVLAAVTGRELGEDGLYRIGERICNLQRAVLLREGHGGKAGDYLPESWYSVPLKSDPTNPDCIVPGEAGAPHSRKGAVVERDAFEETRREFYRLRGWNPDTGIPEEGLLSDLGLSDISI